MIILLSVVIALIASFYSLSSRFNNPLMQNAPGHSSIGDSGVTVGEISDFGITFGNISGFSLNLGEYCLLPYTDYAHVPKAADKMDSKKTALWRQ
jgi:hypothetical protein